jgi:hypothetical protein
MRTKVARLRIAVILAVLGMFVTAAPAWAASVDTAQIGSHGPAAHVNGATVQVTPNIQEASCTGRATWVHMTINGRTRCFGNTGTLSFTSNNTTYFCAGNNYGTLQYWLGGVYLPLGFTPGTVVHWSGGVDVVLLTINGWRGSNHC